MSSGYAAHVAPATIYEASSLFVAADQRGMDAARGREQNFLMVFFLSLSIYAR
jgi:hypothetical protein